MTCQVIKWIRREKKRGRGFIFAVLGVFYMKDERRGLAPPNPRCMWLPPPPANAGAAASEPPLHVAGAPPPPNPLRSWKNSNHQRVYQSATFTTSRFGRAAFRGFPAYGRCFLRGQVCCRAVLRLSSRRNCASGYLLTCAGAVARGFCWIRFSTATAMATWR